MLPHNSNRSSLLIRNEFFIRFLTIFLFLLSFFLLAQALLHTFFAVLSSAPGEEVKTESIHHGLPRPPHACVGRVSPDLWDKPFPSSKVVRLDDGVTRHRHR